MRRSARISRQYARTRRPVAAATRAPARDRPAVCVHTGHVLHLRIIAPADLVQQVLAAIGDSPATTNVVRIPGAATRPSGDLVLCDVAREGMGSLLDRLQQLGVQKSGSISIDDIGVEISDAAREASRAAPGHAADAVVWQEIEQRTHEETSLSPTFLTFMTVALYDPPVRELMGYSWSARQQWVHDRLCEVITLVSKYGPKRRLMHPRKRSAMDRATGRLPADSSLVQTPARNLPPLEYRGQPQFYCPKVD